MTRQACPLPRRGAALLDVLVALVVLATAGIAALTAIVEALHAVTLTHEREQRFRAASALLEAVSLWPRAELDRRLGDRPQGPWTLSIARIDQNLYTLVLRDSAGGQELLHSAVYRPEAVHGGSE